jgi:DMSO/TMAO reductase YedYZ heme-binding membrane subunit
MFDISYLDLSAGMGLCATGLLTFNFLLGMLLSTAYKRTVYWKKLPAYLKKISLDDLHNWTAYVALLFVAMHLSFLLAAKEYKFTISSILNANNAPKQPTIVWLGTFSLYALLLVIITTQKVIKQKMGFRLWKNIHLLSYGTALLFLFHGLLMDPELKDRPTDLLDAEKFFSEACILILAAATIVRIRYYVSKKREMV